MDNAIDLLKNDHKKAMGLLDNLSKTTERASKKRKDLLQKIEHELKAHTAIEEEIFYPAYREAGEKQDQKMFFEAIEEHRAFEDLVLPDLMKTAPDSVEFSGRTKVLKELVAHHAEEEEKEMFARARKLLGKDQLQELGKRMASRKKALLKEYKAA